MCPINTCVNYTYNYVATIVVTIPCLRRLNFIHAPKVAIQWVVGCRVDGVQIVRLYIIDVGVRVVAEIIGNSFWIV